MNLAIHPALIDQPWVSTQTANERITRVPGLQSGQANGPRVSSVPQGLKLPHRSLLQHEVCAEVTAVFQEGKGYDDAHVFDKFDFSSVTPQVR